MGTPVLLSQVIATESREREPDHYRRTNVVQERWNLWQGQDKVAITYSTLTKGTNRSSNKTFARWRTESSKGYYRSKSGVIIPFNYARAKATDGKMRFRNTTFSELVDPHLAERFRIATQESFGFTNHMDLYPMGVHFGARHYTDLHPTLRAAERTDDMRVFCAKVFGKSQVRRDLMRAVGESDQLRVSYAAMFRGLVPVDWIVNFLRNNQPGDFPQNYYRFRGEYTRTLLKSIDPRSYRSLLNEPFEPRHVALLEDMYQLREIVMPEPGRPYRTVNDLHELVVRRRARRPAVAANIRERVAVTRAAREEGKIALTNKAKELHEQGIDKYTFRCATSTEQMTEWGDYMHNCIGGYRWQAKEGRNIYGGIYDEETLVANFEVGQSYFSPDDWEVKQLLGKYNAMLPDHVRAQCEAVFAGANIGIDQYWGKTGTGPNEW